MDSRTSVGPRAGRRWSCQGRPAPPAPSWCSSARSSAAGWSAPRAATTSAPTSRASWEPTSPSTTGSRRRSCEACPKGIDVYFENVGGPLLDMVLTLVNPFARIPLCGMISQYNLDPPDPGPRYLFSMIGNRVLMQGFIISDHLSLYPEFLAEVGGWLKSGRIKRDETVVEGIENAPKAFLGLFAGDNVGKMIVRLAPEAR